VVPWTAQRLILLRADVGAGRDKRSTRYHRNRQSVDRWSAAPVVQHRAVAVAQRRTRRAVQRCVRALEQLVMDLDIPTIAAINGPGPRQEIALLCDLTLSPATAMIGDGNFAAEEAAAACVVNEVLPTDQLLPRGLPLAAQIRSRPRSARRLTHGIITRASQQAVVQQLRASTHSSFCP
jgi:enoyl-CoA hydratase/carnithine racemase